MLVRPGLNEKSLTCAWSWLPAGFLLMIECSPKCMALMNTPILWNLVLHPILWIESLGICHSPLYFLSVILHRFCMMRLLLAATSGASCSSKDV